MRARPRLAGWPLLFCALLGTPAVLRAGWWAVPIHDAAGATARFYQINLTTGSVTELEPRRSGEVLKPQRLVQNLFSEIGRPADLPAQPGEFLVAGLEDSNGRTRNLLLVETPTGYVATISKLGQGLRLGEFHTVSGRPASALAGEGGSFALLVNRDSNGRTHSAFLLNGTSGQCLLFEKLGDNEPEPTARTCGQVPRLRLGSGEAPLQLADGSTLGHLLVDGTDGSVYLLRLPAERGGTPSVRRSEVNLATLFGTERTDVASRSFLLVPVTSSSGSTVMVLAIDAMTGGVAALNGW
ncbi:MAG TPA: hypothetical protein PK413_05630, partial [Thermoanaerobaculia bacterium]|nr:hypothetical protein [Thermoanaerobaculia bacterium]